jgi:uroporphyrinogen decarboxylase
MLNDAVPLVSKWFLTIMCYAVEGQGSKSFDKSQRLFLTSQKQHMFYCKKITDTTILYLKEK